MVNYRLQRKLSPDCNLTDIQYRLNIQKELENYFTNHRILVYDCMVVSMNTKLRNIKHTTQLVTFIFPAGVFGDRVCAVFVLATYLAILVTILGAAGNMYLELWNQKCSLGCKYWRKN